jgi:protease IV
MLRRMLVLAVFASAIVVRPALADDAKSDKKSTPVVAVFSLNGAVTETPAADDFPLGGGNAVSLRELIVRLDKAAKDPAVKAVVFLLDGATVGTAQKEELRQAMGRVRAAGKEIYAHADSLQMGEYALLAGSSRLSVVPTADIWVTGMHGEAMFLRGLLDKLGVQPDFLTCGSHKSAAEQFMRKAPSKEADEMQNWLMDSIYETYLKLIADGRHVDVAKAKAWVDGGPYVAARAKELGLIDAVEQRQDFEAAIKSKCGSDVAFDKKYGEKPQAKIDFSSPFAVFKILGDAMNESKAKKSSKPAVGIVYVDGAISLGHKTASLMGASGGAFSSDLRKALDEAARDDSIKAVVLRVDSPGGSAVASEIILDATRRVKAKKPFVVSMGDVAGSGGYYVACAADTIFADAATITGSIGVVSGKLVTNPAWEKIGVTFKAYERGANAGMLANDHTFTPEERTKMQSYMDEIYEVFRGHVKAIRGDRLKKPLEEISGGRVYTGKQAKALGLIDEIGTLDDAVKFIADKASLSDYEVRVVPEPKNFLEQIMEAAGGGKEDKKTLDTATPIARPQLSLSLLELAAPELKNLDPARLKLLKSALLQLQTLHQEGVSLTMPAYLVP